MEGQSLGQMEMSGLAKAAALVLTMSRETAARLFKHLDREEVHALLRAAADLGTVEIDRVNLIIDEFSSNLQLGPKIVGNLAEVEELVQSALGPEQAIEAIAILKGVKRDSISELALQPEARIVRILSAENPQVAAVVLERFKPEEAARVLAAAPAETRGEWLARMLGGRSIEASLLQWVQEGLGMAIDASDGPAIDPKAPARIANIMNRLEPEEIDVTLDELSELRPMQTEAVRALIFRFDDIPQLSQPARAIIFDQIPSERIVLALRGAPDQVKEAALSALGQRARRMVESEINTDVSVPQKDIMKARRAIANLVLKLADEGAVQLPGAGLQNDGAPPP